MRNHVVKLFLLCALGTLSWAQFDVGSVVGTVKDPSGLPVAGATVELRSQTTNVDPRAATASRIGEAPCHGGSEDIVNRRHGVILRYTGGGRRGAASPTCLNSPADGSSTRPNHDLLFLTSLPCRCYHPIIAFTRIPAGSR